MSWQEELRENITRADQLTPLLGLTREEEAQMARILDRYPMSITRYYLSLIQKDDPNDPIRRMCIPSLSETDLSGTFDTSGEKDNTVVEGMQHKYRETVMILSTNRCAMYCRHCFRKRLVGLSDGEIAKQFDQIMDYIKAHPAINNVLISGGDALLNSNRIIGRYLEELSALDQIDFIRFGSRLPVVFPQRISEDPELLDLLERYNQKKQIMVITQFNHPNELTEEARRAVRLLQERAIPVRNQSVLLRGVNDDPKVMGALLQKLTRWGIIPYYIFQCRPVTGVKNQFQVPFADGIRIVEEAKAMQNGQGKSIKYAFSHPTGKIEVLGFGEDGKMLFKYHEAKDPARCGRIFSLELAPGQCWLD